MYMVGHQTVCQKVGAGFVSCNEEADDAVDVISS